MEQANEEVALLINSLGGTPPMELAVISNSALGWLKAKSIKVSRVYSGECSFVLHLYFVLVCLLGFVVGFFERVFNFVSPCSPVSPCYYVYVYHK